MEVNRKETCLFEIVEKIRVTWEITHRCNFRCVHCCTDADEAYRHELDESEALDVVDQLDSASVGALYISGGEVFVRDDIERIIEHASSKPNITKIKIATNGSLITPDLAEFLACQNLDSILVSLDGHTREINDEFRCYAGAYDDAVRAIELLSSAGVDVRVGTVIWKKNAEYLEEILKIGMDNGAKHIFFNWLLNIGRAHDNDEIPVDGMRYFQIGSKISELRSRYANRIDVGYHRFGVIDDGFPPCLGGERLYHITADGRLGPCSWAIKYDPSLLTPGTLHEMSFESLKEDNVFRRFKDMLKKREETYGIGCPAVCGSENKTFYSKDPLYHDGGSFVNIT
jgi:MoaA/NifB/PqqE/SkfB family radical SAM enzyme